MVAVSTTVADDSPSPNASAGPMADLRDAGYLGSRDDIQAELDSIAAACRQFHMQQPDQVLKQVAAYGARLTELTVLLHRVEALDRQYTRVRTQQVEKWLAELDRQFKVASRLVEVQRQDLALLGGM
jgi:hypothetical protein